MTINLTALQKQRYDTAANWTGANPTLLAGEIGIESDTLRWKVGNGSTAWTSLAYIPGLAYGTARQLLQTNSGATGAEWTSNVDIPGTLDVTGTSTLDGMVLIGTTTSIGGGKFQVSSDTATTLQNFSFNSSANSNTASLQFVRARGTKASPSVVLNDDYLGEIRFIGYGTTYNTGASIRAIVDGDPATSGDTTDMPTKLVFLTSPNGSATPDTRMTIDSAGLVTIPGDLTVNGTTTTINSTTLVVKDKNIEMGVVATPSDVTADGGGITLKGTTDKTINWIDATDAWTFSEHVNIASAKEYRIAGTKVLDATSLGSGVTSSSLTSVGTIATGVWNGTAISDTYLGTISTALKVSNSATTATDANTPSAIVARDASGNFTAGTITASLSGNASTVTTNANLTGDVTSVGNATSIAAGVIVDADVNASAAIADTKLATIATAGKVSNSATTATNSNTPSAIVARDASGNFTAGTITAALTGAASSNVLKAGDTMTGVLAITAGTAALPAITPSGDPNTGIFSPGADQVAVATNGTGRLFVDASGNFGVGSISTSSFQSASSTVLSLRDTANSNIASLKVLGGAGAGAIAEYGASNGIGFCGTAGAHDFTFYTNSSERLRLTSTGTLNFKGAGTAGSTQAVSFNGSAPVNSMVLDSSGRLGIGSSSPDNKLSVGIASADEGVELKATYNGARVARFGLVNPGVDNTPYIGSVAGNDFGFITSNTRRMTLDASGRLGIGSTSPTQKLQVTDGTLSNFFVAPGYNSGLGTTLAVGGGEYIEFATNGITNPRARLTSDGKFLVGTSTALTGNTGSYQSQYSKFVAVGNSAGSAMGFSALGYNAAGTGLANNTGIAVLNFTDNAAAQFASIMCETDAATSAGDYPGRLVFSTTADGASSPTERMSIGNQGYIFPDSSSRSAIASVQATGSGGFKIISASTTTAARCECFTDSTSTRYGVVFSNPNGIVGSISTNASATAFNTSSDYRLKENVTTVTDGITRLQQLKPSRFNFIADPNHTVDGFIAHEAQAVVPECVTGEKDAVDDDGNPKYQGIDQSKLVPLLTAALQEAIAKIETLEARLTAAGL